MIVVVITFKHLFTSPFLVSLGLVPRHSILVDLLPVLSLFVAWKSPRWSKYLMKNMCINQPSSCCPWTRIVHSGYFDVASPRENNIDSELARMKSCFKKEQTPAYMCFAKLGSSAGTNEKSRARFTEEGVRMRVYPPWRLSILISVEENLSRTSWHLLAVWKRTKPCDKTNTITLVWNTSGKKNPFFCVFWSALVDMVCTPTFRTSLNPSSEQNQFRQNRNSILDLVQYLLKMRYPSFVPRHPPLSGRSVPGYSALRFQDGGQRSIKTKVTAPLTERPKEPKSWLGNSIMYCTWRAKKVQIRKFCQVPKLPRQLVWSHAWFVFV